MTISEARSQLSREKAEAEMGVRIEKTLAGRTGGSFLDANGELVVTTLDAAGKAKVTGNGADAKVVDDSTARLDSIMQAFDRQAAAQGPGKSQGWRVDVPTNTVVMTVTDGASDPTTDAMRQARGDLRYQRPDRAQGRGAGAPGWRSGWSAASSSSRRAAGRARSASTPSMRPTAPSC